VKAARGSDPTGGFSACRCQGWKTFLRNHADGIASIDMFMVPTVSFRLLYGLLILQHARRELLWLGVTAHPNARSPGAAPADRRAAPRQANPTAHGGH
jgi:hypothetical protein